MKITIGTAQRLLGGLMALERDEKTKLGEARIKIALNMVRLQPVVEAYERASQARQKQLLSEATGNAEVALAHMQHGEDDAVYRAQEESIDLKTITMADLKLSDNPRITGAMLAQIAPIISDFEG